MKSEIISIIIPAYNCEKSISETIESVLVQTYRDFELIIVDDGSYDKTKYIIQNYIKKDSRIKYVFKENGGVSSARNLGIEVSIGKYITFIDSDDQIDKNFLKILYMYIKKNDYDIVKCGFKSKNVLKKAFDGIIEFDFSVDKSKQKFNNYFINTFKFNQVWGQLIKRDVIGDNRFDITIRMGEDYKFNFYIYNSSNRILVIPECLYIYSINDAGINYNKNKDIILIKVLDIIKVYHELYNIDHNKLFLIRMFEVLFSQISNFNLFDFNYDIFEIIRKNKYMIDVLELELRGFNLYNYIKFYFFKHNKFELFKIIIRIEIFYKLLLKKLKGGAYNK